MGRDPFPPVNLGAPEPQLRALDYGIILTIRPLVRPLYTVTA